MNNIFDKIKRELLDQGFKLEKTDFNRPWGGFFAIEETQASLFIETFYPKEDKEGLTKGGRISPKILVVQPDKRLSWQYHHRRSEVWKLVEGEAGVVKSLTNEENELEILRLGDKITIQQGERHRIVGLKTYGVIAEIWQHTDNDNLSDEEDIVRLQDDFNRK